MRFWRTLAAGAVAVTILCAAAGASAQEGDLAAARELYASAAYDDALAVLNRLRSTDHPAGQSRAIEQYRAFCLLALGPRRRRPAGDRSGGHRGAELPAERKRSVAARPHGVRGRPAPDAAGDHPAEIRAGEDAFDRKDFKSAATGFSQVLVALADPAVSAEASRPPLSDLRMLAVGFEELSAKAAAPPPPPVVAPPPVPVAAPAPPQPVAIPVYSGDDRNVIPPSVINQTLPFFPGAVFAPRYGVLEILINEAGEVESAVMTQSVTSAYDRLVLAATRTWRYKPASANGMLVKYRKIVQINIKSGT